MRNLFRNMRLLSLMALLLSVCVFTSCDDDNDDEELLGDWEKRSDFAGVARTNAVSFIIDGKVYVGTGYDGTSRLRDFWMYDPAQNAWFRKASLPAEAPARSSAVGFSANGKGYIGTGYDGTVSLKDFYEYNPATDEWTRIQDFPASARYGALSLSFDNAGYVGAGFDGNYQKDFWKYDPATGTWSEQIGLTGAKRMNGFAFTVNGKGYIGGGRNNSLYEADMLEFDPATGTWRNLKSLNDNDRDGEDYPTPRASAGAFSIGNFGYIVGGNFGSLNSEVWQYDPASDTWKELAAFDGGSREGAIGFGIGNAGYIGLGNSGTFQFDDLWQLDPNVVNED